MKRKVATPAAFALVVLAMAASPVFSLHPPPEATATAKKGPVQLTLRLYRKKVKAKKSLWYQIELKNVGKEKIAVDDRIFLDPWQMHQNCSKQQGIYFEVQAVRFSDGSTPEKNPPKPYDVPFQRQIGAQGVHYDFFSGVAESEGKAVNAELKKLEVTWEKDGFSQVQKELARDRFWSDWNEKKRNTEDEAKRLWLAPGASTTTIAWAFEGEPETLDKINRLKAAGVKGPEFEKNIERFHEIDGVENQIGDYTQLWDYEFEKSGKYRIRAIYDRDVGYEAKELARSPWYVRIKTPFIDFEVLK